MMDSPKPPVITLFGPPGVGKSALGAAACARLGLRFLDLSTEDPPWELEPPALLRARFLAALRSDQADVIALPWSLAQDQEALQEARRRGELTLIWDHPLASHARSRLPIQMTPASRLKTKGGFGLNGHSCREYRHMERAATSLVEIHKKSFAEAVELLRRVLQDLRAQVDETPAERAGTADWEEYLSGQYGANKRSAALIADAAGRYLLSLQSEGTSPRKIREINSDLQAHSMIVFMYDNPPPKKIIRVFCTPQTFTFERKFLDSASALRRYESSVLGFAQWARTMGLLDPKPD